MKRILLALIAVTFFFFVDSAARAEEIKTFTGTIKSFPHGPSQFKSGPPLWPFGMIVVAADNGEKSNFLIVGDGENATTFYDIDGKSGTVGHIQVKIGQKVEVKYVITEESMRYLNKALAISVRYVPLGYVQPPVTPVAQTTSLETPANTSEANIFVGKIERSGGALRYWWKFTAVADNGEKKEFRVPRGGSTIIQIDGKQRYGEAPRKGRKIEVKYLVTENGDNVTTSMRYVPLDYVQQPVPSATPANTTPQSIQEATAQSGGAFIGKVKFVRKALPRPPYWRMAILTVISDSGEKKEIDIVGDTALTDTSGKEIGKGRKAWGLKNGGRVEVKYSPGAKNGHDKAILIHCLD